MFREALVEFEAAADLEPGNEGLSRDRDRMRELVKEE